VLDASSHGRVAPKTKTINVNANLLSERLAERENVREWVRRRLVFAGISLVIACMVLPPLHRAQQRAFIVSQQLKKEEAALTKQIADLQDRQDKIKPALDNAEFLNYVHASSQRFLGHTFLFLDNVKPNNLALGSLKATVTGGTLELATTADAVNYRAAQDFVSECEKTPNVQGTFVSQMRSNTDVGDEGVTFDLSQKVKVGP